MFEKRDRMLKRVLKLAEKYGPFVRFFPDGSEGSEGAGDKSADQTMDKAFAGDGEPAGEPAGQQAGSEPATESWKDNGFEDFEGKSIKEIAAEVQKYKYNASLYGRQANELGTARQQLQEAQTLIDKYKQVSDPDRKAEQKIEQMSEGQLADFYREFESNPRAALLSLLDDKLGGGGMSDEDFQKRVDERVNEQLRDYHGYSTVENLRRNRPEYGEHEDYIQLISQAEHLGQSRNPEDLLDFSILHKANKTLANVVYGMLKSYPGMAFADAKEYAELKLAAPASNQDTKEKLKKEVAALAGGKIAGGGNKASQDENIESMEDAFNVD